MERLYAVAVGEKRKSHITIEPAPIRIEPIMKDNPNNKHLVVIRLFSMDPTGYPRINPCHTHAIWPSIIRNPSAKLL